MPFVILIPIQKSSIDIKPVFPADSMSIPPQKLIYLKNNQPVLTTWNKRRSLWWSNTELSGRDTYWHSAASVAPLIDRTAAGWVAEGKWRGKRACAHTRTHTSTHCSLNTLTNGTFNGSENSLDPATAVNSGALRRLLVFGVARSTARGNDPASRRHGDQFRGQKVHRFCSSTATDLSCRPSRWAFGRLKSSAPYPSTGGTKGNWLKGMKGWQVTSLSGIYRLLGTYTHTHAEANIQAVCQRRPLAGDSTRGFLVP